MWSFNCPTPALLALPPVEMTTPGLPAALFSMPLWWNLNAVAVRCCRAHALAVGSPCLEVARSHADSSRHFQYLENSAQTQARASPPCHRQGTWTTVTLPLSVHMKVPGPRVPLETSHAQLFRRLNRTEEKEAFIIVHPLLTPPPPAQVSPWVAPVTKPRCPQWGRCVV